MKFVRVTFGKDEKMRFFDVPKEKAEGILKLINDFEIIITPTKEERTAQADGNSKKRVTLKELRTKSNMRQIEVARKTDVSQSYIAQLENGNREMSKKFARKLGELFKIDYRDLL